ncbi:MAG: arsenate reductase ArsC [bacterium]|nr:arsenate reductase ArsC [bacterium]
MKVLFVCTANSCRSQMAETWAHHLFPPDWSAFSGGLLTYRITEKTKFTMKEVGLDMTGQDTKTIDTFDLNSFDLVVTLSKESTQFLPPLANPARHIKRPMRDPMSASGNSDEVRLAFRTGRDHIQSIVQDIVAGIIQEGD